MPFQVNRVIWYKLYPSLLSAIGPKMVGLCGDVVVLLLLMDMPDACLVFIMSFICQLRILHHTLSVSQTKHFYHKDITIVFPPFSVHPTNSVSEKKLFCLVHFLALTTSLMLKCLERF